MNLLPEVHASGVWKLKTPFENYIVNNTWYTCIAVRKIEDYVLKGIDAYKEFYEKPFKLSKTIYDTDVKAGVCIVTIKNLSGDIKSIPSSYLLSFPAGGGIPYHALALVAELGAIPEQTNLTHLEESIKGIILDTIGIETKISLVNLAPRELIEGASHRRLEEARKAKIKLKHSPHGKILELEEKNKLLTKKVSELEKYIINKSKP